MNYRPKLTGRCHFWFIGACAFRFVVVVSEGLFCYFLFFISFAFFWGSKGGRLLFVAFSFFFSFRSVFFLCVCVSSFRYQFGVVAAAHWSARAV